MNATNLFDQRRLVVRSIEDEAGARLHGCIAHLEAPLALGDRDLLLIGRALRCTRNVPILGIEWRSTTKRRRGSCKRPGVNQNGREHVRETDKKVFHFLITAKSADGLIELVELHRAGVRRT